MTTKTTTAIRTTWSARRRTERTFLANLSRSACEAKKKTAKTKRRIKKQEIGRIRASSAFEIGRRRFVRFIAIYYIHDCSLLPNRTISFRSVIRPRSLSRLDKAADDATFETRLG